MVKFKPPDVAMVLFEAGHETPVEEEPDAVEEEPDVVEVAEAPALEDVELGATQLGF